MGRVSIACGRRWMAGALLVVAGLALYGTPAFAQGAGGPAPVVGERSSSLPSGAPSNGAAQRGGDRVEQVNAQAADAPSSVTERIVDVVTSPVVAALLIAFGVLLLLADLFTAGFGLAGLLGLGLLALFFWGHAHAGLAGWEGAALLALGLALLGLELLVIPGFGVAGVLGLAALVGGLFLSLLGDGDMTGEALVRAGATVGTALITIVAGGAALLWLLPQQPWLRGLVLQTNVSFPETTGSRDSPIVGAALDRDGIARRRREVARETGELVGAAGVALTDLRPSGHARIDGASLDVVTGGEYIAAGTPVEVVTDEGYRRVVRRATARDAGTGSGPVPGGREAAGAMGEEDERWTRRAWH